MGSVEEFSRPREARKLQTRHELVRAALDLFREQGYQATTVDHIVQRAGCARSTFFRHFPTREDVLFGDVPRWAALTWKALGDSPPQADAFRVAWETITAGMLEFVSVAPELQAECMAYWISEPALVRRWMELIIEAEATVESFLARSWGNDRDAEIMCAALATGIIGVARTALRVGISEPSNMRRLLNRGFDALEQGGARTGTRLLRRPETDRRGTG